MSQKTAAAAAQADAAGIATDAHREALKGHIGEVGDHLKQAATLAGDALREAAVAARSQINEGRERIRTELDETAESGRDVAREARAVGEEQIDLALAKGQEVLESARDLIREKPLAAFGIALASGWVIAKLGRR